MSLSCEKAQARVCVRFIRANMCITASCVAPCDCRRDLLSVSDVRDVALITALQGIQPRPCRAAAASPSYGPAV